MDDYLVDGAEVAVVSSSTRENGNGSTTVLHEGVTYVQDADGDENYVDVNGERIYTGFNGSVSPGGEVGAGGNGVDACFGDSVGRSISRPMTNACLSASPAGRMPVCRAVVPGTENLRTAGCLDRLD